MHTEVRTDEDSHAVLWEYGTKLTLNGVFTARTCAPFVTNWSPLASFYVVGNAFSCAPNIVVKIMPC